MFRTRLRNPDEYIGGVADPYMLRWVLFRSRFGCLYLHRFLRSDDERALHDHPAWSVSLVLTGGYYEVLPHPDDLDFKEGRGNVWSKVRIRWRRPLSIIFRQAAAPHRITLGFDATGRATRAMRPTWSLWLRGPNTRQWGFYTSKGWQHWREYTGG